MWKNVRNWRVQSKEDDDMLCAKLDDLEEELKVLRNERARMMIEIYNFNSIKMVFRDIFKIFEDLRIFYKAFEDIYTSLLPSIIPDVKIPTKSESYASHNCLSDTIRSVKQLHAVEIANLHSTLANVSVLLHIQLLLNEDSGVSHVGNDSEMNKLKMNAQESINLYQLTRAELQDIKADYFNLEKSFIGNSLVSYVIFYTLLPFSCFCHRLNREVSI